MEELFSLIKNKKSLPHQIFLLIGETESIRQQLLSSLDSRVGVGDSTKPLADLIVETHDLFGVEDGRNLKKERGRRSLSPMGKFFVLVVNNITTEAQNSLLKTLEEPGGDNYFFLISPTRGQWLPTVLSRCSIWESNSSEEETNDLVVKDFLLADLGGREEIKTRLLKDHENGDKNNILNFVRKLLLVCHEGGSSLSPTQLARLSAIVDLASARGSVNKMLLEYLILTIPVTSK